jgi:transposase InsO family protein
MHQLKKSRWGVLKAKWVTHDTRDEIVDYVQRWSDRTGLPAKRLVQWIGLGMSKYYDWKERYGQVNEHNGLVPRDHWLEAWEREAILAFHAQHPLEGYRRLTYMLMDADRVAASPATVYRVLKAAGCFQRWNRCESSKGQGFQQPLTPHEHWHIDISYVNVCGTFYYLISVLDGASRYIVHWELRESMKEADVEIVLQRAREAFPGMTPRIISDNGPQFVARDFKEFIRRSGMTHVRTSPYYPQSNGKLERWHGTLKQDCLRPGVPLSIEEARTLVGRFVEHYNHVRLHSAIGYVTPADRLAGRQAAIFAARDQKLAVARKRRATRRNEQASCNEHTQHHACENGTQRKASGVQGAAMSPLVARAIDSNLQTRPTEGETKPETKALNSLTPHCENSISH